MMEQLADATVALQKDGAVRAVLLRGEGRAFCAGADVGTMQGLDVLSGRQRIQRAHRVIAGLANLDKPVIAVVRGATVGVGWSLALACDLILASDNASFSLVFKKIGLAPDGAAAYFLTQYIGVLRARELMMTARMVPAGRGARSSGMVNEVLPDDAARRARRSRWREELAESATFALAMGKRMFRTSCSRAWKPSSTTRRRSRTWCCTATTARKVWRPSSRSASPTSSAIDPRSATMFQLDPDLEAFRQEIRKTAERAFAPRPRTGTRRRNSRPRTATCSPSSATSAW